MNTLFLDPHPDGGFIASATNEDCELIPLKSVGGERVNIYVSEQGRLIEFPSIHPTLVKVILAGARQAESHPTN